MEQMPNYAPFVILALLGACGLMGLAAAAAVFAWALGRRGLIKFPLAAGLAVLAGYFGLMVAVSLASHERVLAPGEHKYFCEVDCHEAYSVAGIRTAKTLGPSASPVAAQGTFYVVTVKVWFDESTISPHRGNGYLNPNDHQASVVDESGKRYEVSSRGQAAFEQAEGKTVPFTQPLRPGESHLTTLVFDLPADARNPRLFITTEPWFTQFLIGHENSFFHKKILFRLEPVEAKAAANQGFDFLFREVFRVIRAGLRDALSLPYPPQSSAIRRKVPPPAKATARG